MHPILVISGLVIVGNVYLFIDFSLGAASSVRLTVLFLVFLVLVGIEIVGTSSSGGSFLQWICSGWAGAATAFLIACLLSGLLMGIFEGIKRLSTDGKELVFGIGCWVLAAHLWFTRIGSYSYLRDVLGIALSFGLVMVLTCRWSKRAVAYIALLVAWALPVSWVVVSLLDWGLEREPLPITPDRRSSLPDDWPDLRIGLALSGGGYRAPLVHAGVLHALEARNVHVTNLSAVSGGSIIASFYAKGGDPRDFCRAVGQRRFNLLREFADAQNLLRLLPGLKLLEGTDVQANLVDRRLLNGWLAKDLNAPSRPRLMLGTTDLHYGLMVGLMGDGVLLRPLPSVYDKQEFLENIDGVLAGQPLFISGAESGVPSNRDRVADFVAASGAFPIAFAPKRYSVREKPGRRYFDEGNGEDVTHELVLSDGGLSDNYGLRLLLDANWLAKKGQEELERFDIRINPRRANQMPAEWKLDLVLVSDGGQLFSRAERVSRWDLIRILDVIAESTGAPPERRWGVQLTDYTLMALRADGVPREVLEKLGRIRGSAFNSERTFLEALAGKLTPEELDRYRVKLLYHAQHSGAEPQPEMVLFSPARFVMRTGSPIMSQPEIKAPKVGFLRRIVWPSIDLTEFGDTERKFLLDLVPQPDAGSLKDEELIEMIEKDIEDCLLVFQESSTLKDQYRPEEAESLYRLGQYLVILRWPEIKTALGRARARKGQQPE